MSSPTDRRTTLETLLGRIARQPASADLWALRGALLTRAPDHPSTPLATEIAREFFLYLSELESKLTARQYNELASRLDISSVGTLALQDILVEQEALWKSLFLGGIGESLMVLASRQYIKAWEQELAAVHRRTAWKLYEVLWQTSQQYQPDMTPSERQSLIASTLAPMLASDTPIEHKMLLTLRLLQTLLVLLVAPMCAPNPR